MSEETRPLIDRPERKSVPERPAWSWRSNALLAGLGLAAVVLLAVTSFMPGAVSGPILSLVKYSTATWDQASTTSSTSITGTPIGLSGSSSDGTTTTTTTSTSTSTEISMDTGLIYSSNSATAATTVFDLSNSRAISNGGAIINVPVQPTAPIDFDLARDGYDVLPTLSHDYLKYTFLEHYDAVVEPYATMNLVISDYNETLNYYRYSICPFESQNSDECSIGSLMPSDGVPETTVAVNVSCDVFDKYYIYVTEFEVATEKMTRTTTGSGLCMYVRREIRSLSTEDLSATMDAMYALWEYDQDEGEEIYGSFFFSASTLLKFHHFNSAWQDADHIHEGNGFILQHIKQTNIFEKSMQSVDPSVSLPYWDFTIESANGTALWESDIFTPDVFGSMPNCSDSWWGFQSWEDIEDAKIPDGRWAGIKADWNEDYEDLLAGYGYMRAPWSMNPSPYVSRFTSDWQIGTTLPRCSSHYGMLEYTDLMDFLMDAGDDPHSSAHSLIGGMYGCDYFSPLLAAGLINDHTGMMTICGKWAFVMKELYRNNLISPYTNCSTTTYDCGFECVNEDDDSGDLLFLVKELISDSVPSTMGVPQWEKWEDFICSGNGYKIVPGDHLESASPTDPSFWPIHPTLERLLHAKFMSGGFENNTWHTDPINENVCHHASCYESYINDSFAFYPECCYGHYQYDQMLNAISGSKYEYYGPTNEAILSGTNPTGMYTMPYIYDDFSWDHCLNVDVDFDDLLDGFYKQYVTMEDDYMDDTFNSTMNMTIHAVHTPHPTKFPTMEPTHKPTHSPDYTHPPTFEPTVKPTRSPDSTRPPSNEPTVKPTYKPTHSPDYTHPPSFEPSTKPTRSPDATHSPTNPTQMPSPAPSFEPTTYPTRSPDSTSSPTHSPDWTPEPTQDPTQDPTHSPDWTPEPTLKPTRSPDATHRPTDEPTEAPTTSKPTSRFDLFVSSEYEPSALPTALPTTEPSLVPTSEPSASPSVTAKPTNEPTNEPTAEIVSTDTTDPTTDTEAQVEAEETSSADAVASPSNHGPLSTNDVPGEPTISSSKKSSKKSDGSKKMSSKKEKRESSKKSSKKKNGDDEERRRLLSEKATRREQLALRKQQRELRYKAGDKNSRFRLRG